MQKLLISIFTILFFILIFHSSSFSESNSKKPFLMQQDLPDFNGKEVLMLTVSYSPGESSPIHRHNAHTFVYVLEGSVTMQIEGGDTQTLNEGDTFYESPDDIHKISKNSSDSLSAKFLVFFVKDKGAPPLIPVQVKP